MKTLIAAIILAIGLNTHATIVVYKGKVTGTSIGENASRNVTMTGYTVLEMNSSGATALGGFTIDPVQKKFRVDDYSGYQLHKAHGAQGKQYLAFSKAISYFGESDQSFNGEIAFFKGQITGIQVMKGLTLQVPKMMSGILRNVMPAQTPGASYLGEAFATLTYEPTFTAAYNTYNYDLAQAINALRGVLLSQGYTEIE